MLLHFGHGTHRNPLANVFFKAAFAGWTGVDLFFVLSGFLITRILLATRGSSHFFRDFYLRRVLRIFPLAYGVLAAVLLIAPLVTRSTPASAGPSSAWLWLYASNIYLMVGGSWFEIPNVLGLKFGHFWTLAVEEQFYLLWPLCVWRLDDRSLARLCVALAVFCFSLRLALAVVGVSLNAIYCLTPCRMDALLVGGFVAILSAGDVPLVTWRRPARLCAAASGAVIVGSMIVSGCTYWPDLFARAAGHSGLALFAGTAGYSLLALLFGAVVVLAVTAPAGSLARRLLEGRLLTFFGKYSYGLYVFHGLLWPAFDRGRLSVEGLTARFDSYLLAVAVHLTAATAISVALAYLSWHLYEKQFLKLKRYFSYRAAAAPAPAPALAVVTEPRPTGG